MEAHILCPCGGRMRYCGRQTIPMGGKPLLSELTATLQPMELYLCPECRRSAFLVPCDRDTPTTGDIAALYAAADSEELRTILNDELCTPTVRAAARQILQERG